MAKKNQFKLLSVTLLGLFLCFFGWESLAVASELPPGVIVGDDSGVKADVKGKYFIEHNDIKPGITFKKTITISNYSQEPEPFDLRLAMKGDVVEGEIDLLEAITVTLILEGKEIYKGSLSGKPINPEVKLPLHLGKYNVGDTKVLEATFQVSSDLPAENWKNVNKAGFYWGFYATKEEEPVEKPKPPIEKPKPPIEKPKPFPLPQTNEEWAFVIMGIIIGVFFVMISLIIAKKKRNSHF